MECDICGCPASGRLPFNCTLCARDALYQPRIELAHALLQLENLAKQVETTISGTTDTGSTQPSPLSAVRSSEASRVWAIQRGASQQIQSEQQSQDIFNHVQTLREEIQKTKLDITARKARIRRRISESASARQELAHGQSSAFEPIEKGIHRTGHRWDTTHSKSAESSLFLCREAAQLYGLQQRKRKKGSTNRDVFFIGGLPIADIRDLNDASPAQITTSTTNLAHLVHLVSHYLSLKLPAEITLPHRDYPLPTIFSPSSSYSFRDVPFPGSTPQHSSSNSPSASRHADHRPLPKPRPLYLDKKLSVLAKEDQVAYASFAEGITLLAWDIAWLCKTQGVNVGENSWEDVCAMGKNLWQLLLAPPPRPLMTRETTAMSTPQQPLAPYIYTPTNLAPQHGPKKTPPPGHFSHGTAYGYLASAAGSEYMHGWRLQNPIKVIEKVKAMLLAERTGAEWEILEGNEWEEDETKGETKREGSDMTQPSIEETGVLVKPKTKEIDEKDGNSRNIDKEEGEEKGKGTSGWTKLKNR